ncbi:MAG: hypothetical protein GXY36_01515 [Chloroflexi bacterium]|nr:hypothetical protein [Chloroflexota bacterium]
MSEILVVLGALGLSGGIGAALWAWERRGLRAYVIRVRTEWVRAGQRVHYGPVFASCLSTRPRESYSMAQAVSGALGLTDHRLVFVGRRATSCDSSVPLDLIRWIEVRSVPVGEATNRQALFVHYDGPAGWRVYSFVLDKPHTFARQLSQFSGEPLRDVSQRQDYGPASATRVFQDIHGQWQTDRETELYLAPDRLLFGWRSAIPLASIRQLAVIERGGLSEINPFSTDLLRIEHETSTGERQITGYVVRHAQRWAEAIQRRSQAPLTIQEGRKKKHE